MCVFVVEGRAALARQHHLVGGASRAGHGAFVVVGFNLPLASHHSESLARGIFTRAAPCSCAAVPQSSAAMQAPIVISALFLAYR